MRQRGERGEGVVSWPGRRQGFVIPAMLTVVVTVAFAAVCGHEFLNYDDNVNIFANNLILHFSTTSLARFWSAPYEGLYIPLTYTVWGGVARLAALFPMAGQAVNPHLFHGVNLLVHVGSTLTLYLILRRLVASDWSAAAGALFFALHPVQVEAVAWATGLKDTLSGLLGLLAIWQYTVFAQAGEGPRWRPAVAYALASLFFAASLLAKPGAVIVPLVAGVVGGLLLRRPPRRLAYELLPWLLIALPVVVVTKGAQPGAQGELATDPWQRLLVAGDALSFYLGKVVWPWTLSPDYGRTPERALSGGLVYATGLLPWLVAGLLAWKGRSPWVLAGVGIFTAVLLPVLGFLPFSFQSISTVADRYLYLAMFGPALVLGHGLTRLADRTWAWGALIALLLVLGARTMALLPQWQDSMIFNTYVLAVNPRSWIAHTNLGALLADKGQHQQAMAAYEKAIACNPTYANAYYNMGVALSALNREDEAVAAYQQAMAVGPSFFMAYNNLANLYISRQQLAEAQAVFRQAVEVFAVPTEMASLLGGGVVPPATSGESNPLEDDTIRAKLYNIAGRLYHEAGRPAEAIAAFRQANTFDPAFPEAYNNLGNVYAAMGRSDEAQEAYQQAIALSPTNAEAYNNLCLLYGNVGRNDEAVALCQQAIARRPTYAEAYLNLGNAQMALNRHAEALAAYNQALELNPRYAMADYNVAVVYQTTGNIEAARAFYRKAVEVKPDFAEAYNNLGLLAQTQGGREEEAVQAFQQAVRVNPGFAPAQINLARVYLAGQQFELAAAAYRQAKAAGMTDPMLESSLGPYLGR